MRERQVVEHVDEPAPLGLLLGRELAEQEQRRDAVLVLHVLGVDAVAQRLLVPEHEPLHLADPLEAGEGLGERLAGGGGHLPEQARGHDGAGVGAGVPGGEQMVGQQGADLVAAEHPPAVGVRHRRGAPVGVRVVGHHEVDPAPLRPARSPGPSRPAPPGWGRPRSGSRGRAAPAAPRRTAPRSPPSPAPARPTSRRPRAEVCRRAAGRADRPRPGPRPCRGRRRRCPPRASATRPDAAPRPAGPRLRCEPRSRRPQAARSGFRRRGRPCSRCRAAGCGWPSPSHRPRSRARG